VGHLYRASRGAPLDQLVLLDRVTGFDGDERLHRLAGVGVGHTHYGDIGHRVVLRQDDLDLRRIDVEPRDDDEILDSIDDVQIPVLVHHCQVTGVEPARFVDGADGGLGVIPVSVEHVRPADPDLARITDEHIVAVAVDQADVHSPDGAAD